MIGWLMEKYKGKKDNIEKINPFQTASWLSISSASDTDSQKESTSSVPDANNSKKEMSTSRRHEVRFRCSLYEKKLLQVKAERSLLSRSEFCRRAVFDVEIKERLSEDHIEIYKNMVKFHNELKSIENMFRKQDPNLASVVHQLVQDIKSHLENIKK